MRRSTDGRRDARADIKAAHAFSGFERKTDSAEVVKGEQADFHTREEMQAKFVKREKKKKMRKS